MITQFPSVYIIIIFFSEFPTGTFKTMTFANIFSQLASVWDLTFIFQTSLNSFYFATYKSQLTCFLLNSLTFYDYSALCRVERPFLLHLSREHLFILHFKGHSFYFKYIFVTKFLVFLSRTDFSLIQYIEFLHELDNTEILGKFKNKNCIFYIYSLKYYTVKLLKF